MRLLPRLLIAALVPLALICAAVPAAAVNSDFFNRAWMTVSGTPGTGSATLLAAVPGNLTFAEAGVPDGQKSTCLIVDGADFELDRCTYTASGTSVSRNTVIISKIAGTAGTSKLSLTSNATVALSPAAEDFRQGWIAPATNVASATTTDLCAVAATNVNITGTTTITGLGTCQAGVYRQGTFAGALTFTYNASSLILPGAASITTAANDRFGALSLGSGNWIVYWYTRASGKPVVANTASEVGALVPSNNLSDVSNAATAFDNIKQTATTAASGAVQLGTQVREQLTANRTYFVRSDGNNNCAGTTNAAGSSGACAFATFAKAWAVARIIDPGAFNLTIDYGEATATVTENLTMTACNFGPIVVQGDTTTPSNIVLTPTSGDAADIGITTCTGAPVIFRGFKVATGTPSGGTGISIVNAFVTITNMEYGDVGTTSSHLAVKNRSVAILDSYTVSGSAFLHIAADSLSHVWSVLATVTCTGSPAFTRWLSVSANSKITAHAMTFSGCSGVTGTRYVVDSGSSVFTNGGGASYFPGNSAGVVLNGGSYDSDLGLGNGGPLSLAGRSANSTGARADISATAASDCVFRENSSALGCGTIATAGVANNAITNAKAAQMANSTIKCRTTAGTGNPEDCTAANVGAILSADTGIKPVEAFPFAMSDETTALTTGTAKITFRMPYAFTLTSVRCSLSTAQSSGSIFTVDINEAGTTLMDTASTGKKVTIDNTEKTSTTAVTVPVLTDTSLADDAEITADIDQIGDGTAKGVKCYLIGHRT